MKSHGNAPCNHISLRTMILHILGGEEERGIQLFSIKKEKLYLRAALVNIMKTNIS